MMLIEFSNGTRIQTTPNHKFLCSDKIWRQYQYNQSNKNDRLAQGHQLVNYLKNQKISRITFQQLKQRQIFIHFSMKNNHNYIINGYVAHNMQIFVKILSDEDKKILTIDVASSDTIEIIKYKINDLQEISPLQQKLVYAGKVLSDDYSLADYYIQKQSTLDLQIIDKTNCITKGQQNNRLVQFVLSATQKYLLAYSMIQYKTTSQILKNMLCCLPSNFIGLLYKNQIYNSNLIIKKIGLFKNNQSKQSVIVIRNQTFVFNKEIKNQLSLSVRQMVVNDEQVYKTCIQKVVNFLKKCQIQELKTVKQQELVMVSLYTTGKHQEINKILEQLRFQFQQNKLKTKQQNKKLQTIQCLVKNLRKLQNYIGLVHRGMKKFRLHHLYKKGSVWYCKNFTSTSLSLEIAKQFTENINSTVFHIQSLTGKYIKELSFYPSQQQVLFAPFTHFYVDEIHVRQNYDEVWLTQIPSPATFSKPLIVWVDDQPKNNIEAISKIRSNINVEVLQLTTTIIAKQWMKLYGWILNWTQIKFKLLSDMVRQEKGNGINYQAGIDLLQLFINHFGYRTPIMIYCGDQQSAEKNVKARNVKQSHIYRITNKEQQLLKYCTFQQEK